MIPPTRLFVLALKYDDATGHAIEAREVPASACPSIVPPVPTTTTYRKESP